jgi:hypothetical protein
MTSAEKTAADIAERQKKIAEHAAAKKLADTKPLLGDEDPEDVIAAFPARKRPKEPLPEELQQQIRGELRGVSKAPIVLRDTLYLPREDGSAEVLAIYQMSVYEDCMARHPGSRRKARAACLPEKAEITQEWDNQGQEDKVEVELNTECLTYGVVRASLAGRAAEGDRLKVSHLALPEANCRLTALKQFFLDDIDRDGRPELVIAGTAAREVIEAQRRTSSVVTEAEDLLWVLDIGEALTRQLTLSVSRYSAAARTVWVDLDRDERVDLVQIEDCRNDYMYEEEDKCAEVLLPRIWHVYDPALDRWEDDEKPPIAKPDKAATDKPTDRAAADKATDPPAADKTAVPGKPAAAVPASGSAQ